MALLAYLEGTALVEWISISMLGFPTLIALHSVGMAIVVGLSLMITLRLFGFIDGIDGALFDKLLKIAAWGFVLNFLTGVALFITRGTEYITSAIFLIKILLVLIGAAILFALRQRLTLARNVAQVPIRDRVARNMSLVATVTWFGAVVTGRLIAYLSELYR